MRLLTGVSVLVLLGSAFLAARHYARREGAFPIDRFVTADARTRAREGDAARSLGVALAGYEDLVRERPDDLDALRGRIRTAIKISSVGLGQPRMPEIVRAQSDAYVEHRARIDPDGTFLRQTVREWIDGRLGVDWFSQAGFYACASTAIFVGARGEPAGRETLMEITRQGNFFLEFFPFARRYHPGWSIVEPLIVHYLEHGDLGSRVEAGVTLLDYHALFGVGGDLVERFLPVVRDSIREMRERVRAFSEEGASDMGRAAILGMALLASRGEAEEARMLAAAKKEAEIRLYAPHTDTVRVARLWLGLEDFASMGPLTVRFKDMDDMDQEAYYLAVAHRATRLTREGTTSPEIGVLLDLLESAFDGGATPTRILSMQALLRLAPPRGSALIARALDARGPFAVYAGALADKIEDPVALLLPYLGSPMPDVAAIAASTLLDLPAPHALQR